MLTLTPKEASDYSATDKSTESLRQQLRQLTVIRSLILVYFWCGFFTSLWVEGIDLPRTETISILTIFSSLHFLTLLRLRHSGPVSTKEFFAQLLIDVICINIVLYFSGGATNPFISYLLVPVCICATTLPWLYTWLMTALCVAAYSFLLFFHIDVAIFATDHMQMQSQLNWHILGMWFNFFVSAVLITYFVVKMANNLRQQQARINQMREDELRNEQVIAVATLAAGAAHEINTPLATMTVLLAELCDEYNSNPPLLADLQLLSRQVQHSAKSLKNIVQDAAAATQGQLKRQTIKEFCQSILDRWQLMRPAISYSLRVSDAINHQVIAYDSRLDHAIINLLNNAADASPENIALDITLEENNLVWIISDSGSGIHQDVSALIGKTTISTKDSGMGLGMLLSHTTINRYGGSVSQTANSPQGTITSIRLPLNYKFE